MRTKDYLLSLGVRKSPITLGENKEWDQLGGVVNSEGSSKQIIALPIPLMTFMSLR